MRSAQLRRALEEEQGERHADLARADAMDAQLRLAAEREEAMQAELEAARANPGRPDDPTESAGRKARAAQAAEV